AIMNTAVSEKTPFRRLGRVSHPEQCAKRCSDMRDGLVSVRAPLPVSLLAFVAIFAFVPSQRVLASEVEVSVGTSFGEQIGKSDDQTGVTLAKSNHTTFVHSYGNR